MRKNAKSSKRTTDAYPSSNKVSSREITERLSRDPRPTTNNNDLNQLYNDAEKLVIKDD